SMSATRLIGSPLGVSDIPVLERHWSLGELREEIMSREYLDVRSIFLLNWCERGCAPLVNIAITGLNLGDLQERQARVFFAGERYGNYTKEERLVRFGPVRERYEAAILRDSTTGQAFTRRYLPAKEATLAKAQPPRVRFLSADHQLNNAPLAQAQ